MKLSRNESVSEELTQETFFQAYLSIHRFKGESDVFTWLASIAKHVYFKYMKKQKMSVEDSYVGLMTCAYLENSDPESELDRRELVRAVRRVVAGMPEKHRNVVLLRAYAGMSDAEIARSLKISENSRRFWADAVHRIVPSPTASRVISPGAASSNRSGRVIRAV